MCRVLRGFEDDCLGLLIATACLTKTMATDYKVITHFIMIRFVILFLIIGQS